MRIDTTNKQTMHAFYTSTAWIKLRRQALERDHYECVWCKEKGKVTTRDDDVLEVDHIKELEYYPELALKLDNLRTLCKSCHNVRHGRFGGRSKSDEEHAYRVDEWWG